MPSPHFSSRPQSSRAERVGTLEVRRALRLWAESLALRPLLWSLPFVVLGCVLGRAWAEAVGAASPGEAILLAPALMGMIGLALKYLLMPRQMPKRRDAPLGRANWSVMWLAGAVLLGLSGAHAARRWTPASDDVGRLLQAKQSRLQPLQPIAGRVVARVLEVRRGEQSDFAVLELVPAPQTSRNLSRARGRVWAEIKHAPQVLAMPQEHDELGSPGAQAVRAGGWIRARIELRELRPPGSPSERDERLFAIARGCWSEGEIKGVEAVAPSRAGWSAGEINGLLDTARQSIAARFEAGFEALEVPYSRQSARLATAMAFGEGGLREPLPREMRQAFKRAGVSHVLVASGAQVALVCALLWSVARLACAPIRHEAARGWVIALLIVPALIFYALLVGGAASIWRAALIGLGALWIGARGRRMDALSLWCGALGLLLGCDPASLYDLSLQLSFGAAWGLIAFSQALQSALLAPLRGLEPPSQEASLAGTQQKAQVLANSPTDGGEADLSPASNRQTVFNGKQATARLSAAAQVLALAKSFKRWLASGGWRALGKRGCWAGVRGLCGVAGMSLAAHVGTLPILLYAFGTLSLGSLCANLPIVPLSALLVMSGGASLLLPLRPLHALNYFLADGAARLVGIVAAWRILWLETPALSLAWTLLLMALALGGAGAAWWPRLLFDLSQADDENASEHHAPRAPSAQERVLLWRATARAAREALALSLIWLQLSIGRLASTCGSASRRAVARSKPKAGGQSR